MAIARRYTNSVSVADLTAFIQAIFPVRLGDVSFLYHTPYSRSFDASNFFVTSIVLSITPTAGFYASLHSGTKIGFLHRPFTLDRRQVPRLATVLANHKGFDEVLTVGNNRALAERLGLNPLDAHIVRGYKGDPARCIGLVGALKQHIKATEVKSRVLNEFRGSFEGCFGFESNNEGAIGEDLKAIAIMNAFHPEEVDRVLEVSQQSGFLASGTDAKGLLYLTGAAREPGLQYAMERGIKVICVGHRVCEEWGIRYIAESLRGEFPNLRVEEVYEEEEPRERPQRGNKAEEQKVVDDPEDSFGMPAAT